MSILFWILLGLISGLIAGKIIGSRGEDVALDIILGVVGAFFGGWMVNHFEKSSVSGINLYGLVAAAVGAVALLFIYHAGRRMWR